MKAFRAVIEHACNGAALLLVLSTSSHAAEAVGPIHFSGKIYSSTGVVPPELEVFAACEKERARIVGKIESGMYHIDLPLGVVCHLIVGNWNWDASSLAVFDAATAIPLPILVYPRMVPEPALARELIAMGEEDQALRHRWKESADFPKQAAAADGVRQQRLAEIIAAKGWPTLSMVGNKAAHAAWLVAQHAPADLLARWLVLMQAAAARHEISLLDLATSIDRTLVYANRKQLYGTQEPMRPDGKRQMSPVEDVAHLDERRLSMGLPSYAHYIRLMNGLVVMPSPHPEEALP